MKYTVPQKTAVYYNRGNLLLSAAAGSGKTASLTRRIVRLILDGEADISELLVVTFTRAAAGEMRARIRRALAEAVEENRTINPTVSRRASEALSALPSASISTIHSFLYREMRQYFPSLGMPHDTRIMDTGVAKTMRADAMRDTVDDFFAKTGEDGARFSYLADVIAQARDTTAIDRELLWLTDRLTSCGGDARTLTCFADALLCYAEGDGGFFDTAGGGIVLSAVREFVTHYLRVFGDIETEFSENPDVAEKYGGTLSYTLDWLRALRDRTDEADFTMVRESFLAYAPPKLGSLSAKKVCPVSEKFKFFRDRLKADIKNLTENFFSWDEAEIKLASRETAKILHITAQVVGEYFARLRSSKLARSLIDYSDLETIATGLFVGENGRTEAAREVGAKFKYIFIDEYQDTNAVQDAIFRAISGESVRFMVGDIKQSIYRFRGADPTVFSGYRRCWETLSDAELISDEGNMAEGERGEALLGEDGRSLLMSDNFRCDSAVIDFVNMISDHTLTHGKIPYTAGDRLICSKNGGYTPKVPVEVVLIEKKRASRKSESDSGDEETGAAKTVSGNAEAAYVASRIAAMIGKYSASGEHVVEAGDIAILMRSPGSASEDYEMELSVYGIPCVTKRSRAVTSYPSVMLIMCLLNFIDNPMRDIYTAGALRSAVFGFTLSEIIALREMAGELAIFTSLERCAEGGGLADSSLAEKCAHAVSVLRRYKTVSRGMTADRFLEFLIRDANLYAIEGIRASGEERDAIARLCDMARAYESGGIFGGISGFIDYVAESGAEDEASPNTSSGVQIMSIHASKGLEFPIVFLAECGKRRNAADENGTVLFDDVLGLGMMLPDRGGLARCDTALRRSIAAKIRRESTAEEMRMLYVALTRAESTLVVTGKTADASSEATIAAYLSEYADGYDVSRASRYLEWIMGSAAACGERDFYTITSLDAESIESGKAADIAREADAVCELDMGEIEARFDIKYPREYLSKIPSKLTVSRLYPEILDRDAVFEAELDAMAERESGDIQRTSEPPRPSFMTGDIAGGAMRGSATHVFMQFADFTRLTTCGARAELERLRVGGFISASAAELVDLRQIDRFMGSSLMDKLTRSTMVKREFRFNVRMDAAEFTDDAELKEKLAREGVRITVQGVVDCVFRDPDTGSLVLVDYKTDRVSTEEWHDPALADAAFRARHKNQLTYYKRICSCLFEEEISGAFVYSTVLGRCIEM